MGWPATVHGVILGRERRRSQYCSVRPRRAGGEGRGPDAFATPKTKPEQ